MNDDPAKWWRCTFQCSGDTERGYLLIENGASGVEILSDHSVSAYLCGDSTRRDAFVRSAEQLGFRSLSAEVQEDGDWVQQCQELHTSVEAGALTIRPHFSGQQQPARTMNELLIQPGTGFGTGHHASTKMALQLLQHDVFSQVRPRSVLDLGTGSGILAVAAARLFNSQVTAIDIDRMALENARENIVLNDCQDLIRLQAGEITQESDQFDLIVANLYAEVLCALRGELHSHLFSEGHLILSGILNERINDIRKNFLMNNSDDAEWVEQASLSEDSWHALLLQRRT